MWYKTPVRPIDPVLQVDQQTGEIRYYRDSFFGVGQESFTVPPNQSQDQFYSLRNTMPTIRGSIDKRWGYAQASTLGFVPTRAYEYQNETNPLNPVKRLIWTSPTNILATQSGLGGAIYNSAIFTPAASSDVRAVCSRSTMYFADLVADDYNKWDGSQTGGVSNWGIDINDTTGSTTVTATEAVGTTTITGSGESWDTVAAPPLSNLNPCKFITGDSTTFTTDAGVYNPPSMTSEALNATNFGFTVPSNAGLESLKVTLTYASFPLTNGGGSGDIDVWVDPNWTLSVQLIKNGAAYGTPQSVKLTGVGGALSKSFTFSLGKALHYTYSQINDTTFGILLTITGPDGFKTSITDDSGTTRTRYQYEIDIQGASISVTYTSVTPAISVDTSAAGSVTLVSGRIYYYVFRNSDTGHLSDLSLPSSTTGPITNRKPALSGIAVSADPQVDKVWILATADAGDETTLYFLDEIDNGTTTYSDNTPELSLLANNIVQETDIYGNEVGVADNDPPPTANFPTKFAGRLVMGQGSNLYVSKSIADLTTSTGLTCGRYEEAWPPTFTLEISDQADVISAILTDGTALYVGTNRHVWRIVGTGPQDFSAPAIAFNETGILSQEAAAILFRAGAPAGAAWLSPDFRVIASDFNTYQDIGTPIQNILNTINPSATGAVYAEFFSQSEYDIFVLAIPTGSNTFCDTLCVFDTRANVWHIWQFPVQVSSLLFSIDQSGTPRWWFTDQLGNLNRIGSAFVTDHGTAIVATAQTTWMHLGMPAQRKLLNELEVITADSSLSVTVEGADTRAQFDSPVSYVANASVVASPLGPYKVFLAGQGSAHRFHRYTFSSTSAGSDFLDAFNINAIPVHFV